MKIFNRKRIFLISKIFIILLFLYWIFGDIKYKDLIRYYNPYYLYISLLLIPLNLLTILTGSYRFKLITNHKVEYLPIFKSQVLSIGFNSIIPGRISELIKPAYLKTKSKMGFSELLTGVFIERLSDVFSLSILALIISFIYSDQINPIVIILLMLSVICAFYILYRSIDIYEFIKDRVLKKIKSFSDRLIHFLGEFKQSNQVKNILFLGILLFLLSYTYFYLFLNFSATIKLSYAQVGLIFVGTTLAIAIPSLPGGFGSFEAVVYLFLTTFGFSKEEALLQALFLHLSQIVPIVIFAVALLITEDLGIRKLINDIKQKQSSVV